jgi:hypothetical protein
MTSVEKTRAERNETKAKEMRAQAGRLLEEPERRAGATSTTGGQASASTENAATDPTAETAETMTRAAGDPLILGQVNSSTSATVLESDGFGTVSPVALSVNGVANAGGVQGTSSQGIGVQGTSQSGTGVLGESDSGVGTQGRANTGTGIVGSSDQGVGVEAGSVGREAISAISAAGDGIRAMTQSIFDAAVFAQNTGTLPGFGATGVMALGGVGVGVYASGQQAALQLERAAFVGSPTSGTHEAGELVLDANANLYLCKVTGTPGTWKRIG